MDDVKGTFEMRASLSFIISISIILLMSQPALAAWPHIIFPNDEGTILLKGRTYTIQWGSVRVDPVNIVLCREISPSEIHCFDIIARGVPNSGSYAWTVPFSLTNGSNYVIAVGAIGISVATSDFPFTISEPPPAFWSVGEWRDCSVKCGGGTQTRDVFCVDSSGHVIADSYCSGTKPTTTKECNMDPCPVDAKRGRMPWLPILLE